MVDTVPRHAVRIQHTRDGDTTTLNGWLLRPADAEPDGLTLSELIVVMHPAVSLDGLPLVSALVKHGWHVLVGNSRFLGNDAMLLMENCVQDLGAFVRHAREVLGYPRVILLGWSGGGSLSTMYQSQAEDPDIDALPSGERVDLTDFLPADALILVAAHSSRAKILTEFLDPSIEVLQGKSGDLADLDLYGPHCQRPPYDADWVSTYREAQVQRNRRITTHAKDLLSASDRSQCFVVDGTMADVRWLDGTIEPSDRNIGTCAWGVPREANMKPTGIARFSSAKSWLSQWSEEFSNADSLIHLPRCSVPVLVVENSADEAVPPSHTQALRTAARNPEFHVIPGANHFYKGQPQLADQVCDLIAAFIRNHAPLSSSL